MLERTCFHIDKEETRVTHASGWGLYTFHLRTTIPGYELMEIKACDDIHAKRQAKALAKKYGGEIMEVKR